MEVKTTERITNKYSIFKSLSFICQECCILQQLPETEQTGKPQKYVEAHLVPDRREEKILLTHSSTVTDQRKIHHVLMPSQIMFSTNLQY